MLKYRPRYIVIILLISLLAACSKGETEVKHDETDNEHNYTNTSTWLVDWDFKSGLDDVIYGINYIDNIILFGTYFTQSGEFVHTDSFNELIGDVFENDQLSQKDIYLSFINDEFLNDGTTIQKSPDLLNTLLKNPTDREDHIKKIVQYVERYDVAGVEIDYEKIPEELMIDYLSFIESLYTTLNEQNLKLRVVLEPSFPIEQYELPKEPQYIVMAYNLHGYHSDAGPKADYQFLNKLIKQFPNDSYDIEIGLATGGFSWQNDTITALTEQEVNHIIETYHPDIVRDDNSGANTFQYDDGKDVAEVWYADGETLQLWSNHLIEKGNYHSLSYWRAGGISDETLNMLDKSKLHKK